MFLTRFFYAALYAVNLAFHMLRSSLETGLYSVTGRIDPQVIEVETVLKSPFSQVLLANSITLTPGTLTVDLDSQARKLKVAVLTPRKPSSVIPFEKYIGGMLE
ncbi:MAG: cation:proton antiporter [Candidatus Altiarchaeales archaeon]|nr:cation:proton antiporter [Candidatus Altiarchaeales archaeon]MBD3415891.1 cation:proton antiporter [Candidatus Altiarchaeales archaeon]